MLIYFCILIDDDLLRFIILQIVLPIFLIFQACSEVTGNITNSEAFNFECPESYFVIQNRFKEKISWSHIITHCKEGKSTCINGRLCTQQQLLEGLLCYKRKQHMIETKGVHGQVRMQERPFSMQNRESNPHFWLYFSP